MSPDEFEVVSQPNDVGARLVVSGELDVTAGPTLLDHVAVALFDHPDIELDLGGVTFIDSTGLRVLLRIREVAAERGGSARLVDVSPPVTRLLDLTGTGEIFESSLQRPDGHP